MKRIYLLILATVLVASMSFGQTKTQVYNVPGNALNVALTSSQNDTIQVHGTYLVPFMATDSILCVSAASHAAGTALGNSATAGSVNWLKFLNVANVANGQFVLQAVQFNDDSLSAFSGVLFLYNDTTKIAKIADNAQNIFASESFNYRVTEVLFSLQTTGCGTGSTGLWDYQDVPNRLLTAGSGKGIFGKVVVSSTALPKLNGYFRVKIKGYYWVIVP